MRIKNRFRNNSNKNPQSGSNEHSSHSESQSYNSSNNDGSNSGAIPVNLTSPPPPPPQNPVMQNWKAFTDGSAAAAASEIQNNGSGSGSGGRSEKSRGGGGGGGVSNLILLIEQGQWNAASQRAISHPHEVRQLVKLRKTTKTGGGGGIGGGSGGGGAPPLSSQAGGPTSSNSSTANVQISNVKCKALHHACQKLRSVHTNIYQKKSSSNNDTTHESSDYNNNNYGSSSSPGRKSIIEEDEYIEACKCILTLIKIHPEACKERESRHGCLPLHLCVFSMCSTPPPPTPQVAVSSSKGGDGNNGKKQQQGHTKSFSDFFGNTFSSASSTSARPPPISNRSSTASPKFSDNGLLMNMTNSSGNHQAGGSGSHTRNSSADFSVGNISTMIQEESEHQQKLDEHHRQTKKSSNHDNNDDDNRRATQDDMNRLLSSFQRDASVTTEKKSNTSKQQQQRIGLGSTIGTMVMGALTPLDALEEKSRETDSYSTPQHNKLHNSHQYHHYQGHIEGSEANSTLHPLMRPSNPSGLTSIRNYVSPNSSFDNGGGSGTGGGGGDDQSSTRSGGTSTTANSSGGSGNHGVHAQIAAAANNATTTTPHPTPSTTSGLIPPTHEELQRRYLQINTRRRDEFSIRVIDALLDAWPRGSKTASEGGRLPLHMACFGKATVRVMETILRSYPDAARQRNADGFLPIHIAAHWGVSHPDVAPLLLRAYPDGAVGRNRWERTPIEEALGMAGENGREHQMSLVWSLRRHPTYWIHNDITTMLLPRNVRNAPWRIVDMGKDVNVTRSITRISGGGRNVSLSSAVDVDEVGSSDEDEEGIEVQMPNSPKFHNPKQIKALAESTDLSLLIARDKHWEAAALRCKLCPNEAGEALEVKVRGAYTAKITPLLFACEHNPSVELVKALIKANPASLKRRQDPGGQLPIHAACTWGASSGVIDLLLSADPSMAEEQDFLSNLPLHCACYSGAETSIIRALLRVYPQSVWPRNHQGSSAVDIVKRLSHPNRREVLGLLDMTTKNLLERKKKETKKKGGEEGVEVDKDNSLLWV